MRGFDVPFDHERRNTEVLEPVRTAASALGRNLIVAGTDLRAFSDPISDWTRFVYGGLISTALLMERTHHRVLCAASVADRPMTGPFDLAYLLLVSMPPYRRCRERS